MKKILLATSLAALSAAPAFAGTAFSTGPAVTNVTSAACTLLASAVNVNLSNGNIGAYACNTTTASIGVALFFNNEASHVDILKWADTAMYLAKKAGRNLIRFHDGD